MDEMTSPHSVRDPDSEKREIFCFLESGIRENFAWEIWNPGLWNLE